MSGVVLPESALRRATPHGDALARQMRGRALLRAAFEETWQALLRTHGPEALEPWAAGVLELTRVNAGAGCLLAFWRLSVAHGLRLTPQQLGAAGFAAADICRDAGGAAALAAIEAFAAAEGRLGDAEARQRWWTMMTAIAQGAPDELAAFAGHMPTLLAKGSLVEVADFAAAGLRAAGKDRARRRTFFALDDPLARRLIARMGAGPGFAELEVGLRRLLAALWGGRPGFPPSLQPLPVAEIGDAPRRTNIAGPVIRLPEVFPGVTGAASHALYRAASVHAGAHLAYGGPRFTLGKVKPVQMACINLIEDARVEALAMARFPGLRRLWAPFHVAGPSAEPLVALLLARIARALFDPGYQDPDALIAKGRALFAERRDWLDDPSLSFDIGTRLANDLGQRRIRFDARGHVVGPAYRDDGLGLWDFGEENAERTEEVELAVDAARIERREEENAPQPPEAAPQPAPTGRARPAPADERGRIVARYPEWDAQAGLERADWTTIRESEPPLGDPRRLARALERAGPLRAQIARLVRAAKVGRAVRLKRQAEGAALDIDAAIEAAVSRRAGETPDERVFTSSALRQRDLAVLVLLDTSESTRDRLSDGASVLDVETLAVAMLAEAMAGLGDEMALAAFASAGRDDVRYIPVKRFSERYGEQSLARLAGLHSGLSTRLGAALRHAGEEIAGVRAFRKLILVLTDGEPSDIDVDRPSDLVADARRVVLGLRARGIDTFGVTLDPGGVGSGAAIFGTTNTMPVRRIDDLPMRLSELYFRLARR